MKKGHMSAHGDDHHAAAGEGQPCSINSSHGTGCAWLQGADVNQLVRAKDAHIFICGDGAHMAQDVHAALLDLLVQHSGMTPSDAAAHMSTLAKQGRYVRDIWS